MKTITPALDLHLKQSTTTIATCWKITRTDGVTLGFTDHDKSLTIDGITFVASSGYFRSAIANSATTAVDNLEVSGFLDSELIEETALRNGAFDFASVEIFLINWNDPSAGILRLRNGLFGEVVMMPSGLFTIELRGLTQLFSQAVGEVIAPECRADLGDSRCKIKLIPDQRLGGRAYGVGSRVIVPTDNALASVRMPVLNPDFDLFTVTNFSTPQWNMSGMSVRNFPHAAHTGGFYANANNESGSVAREYSMINVGGEFQFKFQQFQIAAGWEVSVRMEFNQTGVGWYQTVESPWEQTTVGVWTERTITATAASGNDRTRITIRFRKAAGNPATGAAQISLDSLVLTVDGELIDPVDSSFEPPSAQGNPPYWDGNVSYFESEHSDLNLQAKTGSNFLGFQQHEYEVTQLITLPVGTALNAVLLDTGRYQADLGAMVAATDWGYTGRMRLEFINASDVTISTATTGFFDITLANHWQQHNLIVNIPPLTRKVRIRLSGGRGGLREDTSITRTKFDMITLDVINKNADVGDYAQFGGVEFACTTAGVSDPVVPVFDHTVGATTNDGTVVWTCVTPRWMFLGEITAEISHSQFEVAGLDAPDNLFTWGVLQFLDGDNYKRSIEVQSWNNTTKIMTVLLPVPWKPVVGTTFRVHAGCDKSRGSLGCGRFGNILNFRGEPDVPGTDQYFKVGGA